MRARLRNASLTVVLGTLRVVLRALSRVVPQSRSVVLGVFPETEGNGVEVARALVRRYPGQVVWLREQGDPPVEVAALAREGMRLVPKASLAGVSSYLRAEGVMFTHGLYGSPRPVARKPVVNLWHGDGPKDVRPSKAAGAFIASTYVVSSTDLFSANKAEACALPPDRVILTGNPRTDQLFRGVKPEQLSSLGIDGPFVLWLPTFRKTRAIGATRTSGSAVADAGEGPLLAALIDGLTERGLRLVVKAHPMDADRRHLDGALTVTDEALAAAGLSLYDLLGASAGLVTDYSSVWVDYLLLDRPIVFLVPDRDTYSRALVPSDVLDWVPGEVVDGAGPPPFERFFADLDADGALDAEARRAVAGRIGLNPTRSSADDLLDELVARGVLCQ
jgi:hypothetical protein